MDAPQAAETDVLARFLDEINQTAPELYPPTGKVEKNETVVGVATPLMRRCWSLMRQSRRDAEQIKLDVAFAGDEQDKLSLMARFGEVDDKADLLKLLFWYLVETHFKLHGCGGNTVGVRENWQFVISPEASDTSKQEVMRRIIGGIIGLGSE
jgi:hypothetical protein